MMRIRNMNLDDIEFAFYCTSSEGWESATPEVFKTFLAFNPAGCFIAEKDSQKIGICIAVAYRENGFIGEFIIIKEMRGKGYGTKLFEHTLQYLKSKGIQNIFLDADLDAVSLYERFGFKKMTRSLRFIGRIKGKNNALVKKATADDINEICLLDQSLFGEDRSFFIKRRFEMYPDLCFIAKSQNLIDGYVLGRPGINLISVAPLALLSEHITPADLLETLSLETTDRDLRIGVLENNKKAVTYFNSVKSLKQGNWCWRMGLGSELKLGLSEKLYAIGSAAKG